MTDGAVQSRMMFDKPARQLFRAYVWIFLALAAATLRAENLPSAYNLIEPDPAHPDITCITAVRDQGALGSCWANAATSAFESSVLKQGLVRSLDDPRIDLSVWHLATHASYSRPKYRASWDPEQEERDYANWGGDPTDAIMYWARGRGEWPLPGAARHYMVGGGPVTTGENELNEYPHEAARNKEDLRPYIPPAEERPVWRLESTHNLVFDHPGPPTQKERNEIKEQLMDTSAVVTDMYADFSECFDSRTATYLYRGKEDTGHEVIIIGWDDTIRVPRARQRGAWLVQNSYGEDDEDSIRHDYRGIPARDMNGCFWLSYADTAAAKDSYSVVAAPVHGYSDRVLENQIFIDNLSDGNSPGEQDKALSVLKCSPPVRLAAVGLMNENSNDTVKVRVYDTLQNARRDDGRQGLLGSSQKTLPNVGYSTVYFKNAIPVSTPNFYVILDFGKTENAAIGIDSHSPRRDGISYIYRDSEWHDLNDYGESSGIVFLKGLTLASGQR